PAPPSGPGAWSTIWPSVGCACRPLACRSSCAGTGSADVPSGGPVLAQLTAATTGILTTAAKDGPFGFCHVAARPGDLVALDTFYVGKPRGHRPGLAADRGRHRHPLGDRCPGRRG